MSRRGASRVRSTREWIVRALLAVTALVTGYVALRQTLGYAMRRGNVMEAHHIAPGDGRITALLAGALSSPAATAADRARADRLARMALWQDPTAVGAATVMGLNADLRGDVAGAHHFFDYAQRLSRREIAPQLWAIEYAVARKDIPATLRHYDIALRTSKQASDLLFPVLASANGDPSIRVEIVRTLARKPAWGSSFVDYLSMNGANPSESAKLLYQLARVGFPVSQGARGMVLKTLISNNHVDEAWNYYASFRSGVDRRQSRDGRFTQKDAPTPFDWNPRQDSVNASIQREETGGAFEFSAPAGVGGVALEQIQLLPEGTYRLEGHSLDIDQSEGARPYWSLLCRGGSELGRIDVPSSTQASGAFSGSFTVPAGCPVQTLELTVRPSEAMTGASGKIDRLRLYPVPQE